MVSSTFSHHEKSCRQICYNASGSRLYSVSKDKTIGVLDVEESKMVHHRKDAHDEAIYSFTEMDNNLIATGDDGGIIKIWDVRYSYSYK